jgi:rRNA processing protein Krr1/Pno1
MRAYRCYLMNKAGLISAVELIECAGDGDAQQAALKILRDNSQHHTIEVWDQARQVFRQVRDAT